MVAAGSSSRALYYTSSGVVCASLGAKCCLTDCCANRFAALQVMLKNPMVLTCGGRELAASEPEEIRNAANVRFYLDKFANPAGFGLLLGFFGLLKVIGLLLDKQG